MLWHTVLKIELYFSFKIIVKYMDHAGHGVGGKFGGWGG